MGNNMINIAKILSITGVLAAMAWFVMKPEFAAVLFGILSLAAFMMAFLPIPPDNKH